VRPHALVAPLLLFVAAPGLTDPVAPDPAASPRVLRLTGDLQSRSAVRVFPRVSGLVVKMHVRESSVVRQGDVLAEIDPPEYEIAVAAAQAAVAQAEAKLAGMEAGGRPEERARAAADVASAQTVHVNEVANVERQEQLFASGGVSRHALDAARRERDVAHARLVSARKAHAMVLEGPRPEEKRMARADLDKARAELRMAQVKLSYTKIRAPFSGVVGQRLVDEGAYLLAASSPQAPALCTLADSSVLKAIVDLPEADLLYVRLGSPARVGVQSDPGHTFPGRVVNLHPYVDTKTRTSRLEIEVPNHSGQLLPGMFVKVEVDAAPRPSRSVAEILGFDVERASSGTTPTVTNGRESGTGSVGAPSR
jgi:multidrug resistance efflux pump